MSFASNLRALIVADATAKAMAEAGNDTGVVVRLNAPTETVYRRATSKQLLRWLASDGRATKLRNTAANDANGARSIAQAALYVVESGMESIECDAEWWGMVDYLVSHPTEAPVLSAGDKTALQTRIAEVVGVAESSLGRPITTADVAEALAGDRTNGIPGPIGG